MEQKPFENNPNSRFQIINTPQQFPGKCCVCGNPSRPVLDFGANLEVRGSIWALYICIECMSEAASIADEFTGKAAERQREASASLSEMLAAKDMRAVPNELFADMAAAASLLSPFIDDDLDALADEADDSSEPSADGGNGGDDEPVLFPSLSGYDANAEPLTSLARK